MGAKIGFAEGYWFAGSDMAWQEKACDPSGGELHTRIFFAALGWMNRIGHAEFPPGVLAEKLTTVDKSTGELRPARPGTLSKAVEKAKTLGWIEGISSVRCLVVSPRLAKREAQATAQCQFHRVNLSGGR